ncbi:uncharacterized protein N7443_009638 [Penicillium atrosanguineum]|uniref:uncharacterized protein n=1 Tax=Penicillium atrosanguineum TaxID=1132637 RepID=UPI0023A5D1CA|nr:uncharacterized protein N7443_009638 [Penicillium atrosanguineum]KAJ5289385.1 hypothetical protein N7443_009638 [Penicillium atrosanguineum]
MDDHPDSALHYGHVGRAVYLPETKTWTFARSFARCTPISYTGLTRTTISPARNTTELQPRPKTSRQADDKLIPNAQPELAGQWPTICDDALSKVITNAADLCDPQISTLFDLGYALDHASDDSASIPDPVAVAAAVTGVSRDTISFRLMRDDLVEIQNKGSQHDVPLLIPSIGDVETTEWSQRKAPIQQVRFARTVGKKAAWMAARLKTSVMIFRPIFQPVPVPAHINVTDTEALSIPFRNSRLDANPVVELLQDFTGGFTLADVTFNPWYSRKFGVVDIMGNWSIWEITGRQKKHGSTYAPRKLMMASLPSSSSPKDSKPIRPRHDGWASIEWVVDSSTLVVSDRRCTMLYEMTDEMTGKSARSSIVELGMDKNSEWVLDMQRSIQDPSHFFVLTTSRLLWFDVTRAPISNGMRPSLPPFVTWRHFRDPEDTTLRISDLMVNGDLYLTLYSRLTDLVQGFPCPILEDKKTELVSVPDPFILKVPKAGDISPENMSLNYSKFVFRQVHHTPAHATICHSPKMTLLKLFWADQYLSIHETLFKGPENHQKQGEGKAPLEGVSFLKAKSPFPPMKESNTDEEGFDDEEFIVEDWDESAISRLIFCQPGLEVSAMDTLYNRTEDLQWTLDWTSVYTRAVDNLMVPTNPFDSQGTQLTLDRIIETLKKDPSGEFDQSDASKTMLEISVDRPSMLNDIDDEADDLARLVSTLLTKSLDAQAPWHYMILPLQFANIFLGLTGISPDPRLDFLETYNHLVDEWVAPLPHGEEGIPDSTRVLKERSVRGIALDLLLARLIRISNVPNADKLTSEAKFTNTHRSQKELTPSSQHHRLQLPSSQMTPTQTSSAKDKTKKVTATNYTALSTYTGFKQPRPMPQNVGNLLSHWQMGVDPATYEWQKSLRLLDEDGNQTTKTSRQRQRKRRSRVMPATATITVPEPEPEPASSLPPTPVTPMIRTWGSQPAQPPMPIQSSQPTMDEAPMTQMERGQFGAREVKKSSKPKKKKRAAGF